ncbi:MAG: hypothetical protein QXD75_04505, partial [Desulfurococcaceae archaeon]
MPIETQLVTSNGYVIVKVIKMKRLFRVFNNTLVGDLIKVLWSRLREDRILDALALLLIAFAAS